MFSLRFLCLLTFLVGLLCNATAQQPIVEAGTYTSGVIDDSFLYNDTLYTFGTVSDVADVIVHRYNYCDLQLIDSVSLSSPALEFAEKIYVDKAGIYLFGNVMGIGFPTTASNSTPAGSSFDVGLFFTCLDKSLNMTYSTRIATSRPSQPVDIQIENGIAHLLIYSNSPDFPITIGPPMLGNCAYMAIDLDAKNLLYSSYLNTSTGIMKVKEGMVHIAGLGTYIAQIDVSTFNMQIGSVTPTNSYTVYDIDAINDLTVITGFTRNLNYPSTDGTINLDESHFITYVDANLNIVFSTLLAGEGDNSRVAADGNSVYITSATDIYSHPTTDGTVGSSTKAIYFQKFDATGNELFSTYIHGNDVVDLQIASGKIHILQNNSIPGIPTTDGSESYGFTRTLYSVYDTDGSLISQIYNPLRQYWSSDPLAAFSIKHQNGKAHFIVDGSRTTILGKTSGPLVTNGTSFIGYGHGGINIYENCPFSSSCYSITPTGNPTLSPASQSVCVFSLVTEIEGESFSIDGTSLPMITYLGNGPIPQSNIYLNYQWQQAFLSSGPWIDIAGAVEQNYTPEPLGTTTCFRRITKTGDWCGNDTLQITDVHCVNVDLGLGPVVSAGGIYNTCPNMPITIVATTTAGTAPYSYVWGESDSPIGNTSSLTVSSVIEGGVVYTVTVTDQQGCQQLDQAIVNNYVADAGPDTTFCEGASVLLGGSPIPGLVGVTYAWSPVTNLSCTACAQPEALPQDTTTYTLTLTVPVTGGGTCTTTDEVTLTPVPSPMANFAGPDLVVCSGSFDDLGLPAEQGFSYAWTPEIHLNSYNSMPAQFNYGIGTYPIPNPITYQIVAEQDGCEWQDSLTITVINADAGPSICGGGIIGTPDVTPNIDEKYSWQVVLGNGTIIGPADQPQITVSASTSTTVYELTVEYNGTFCTDLTTESCAPPNILITKNCPVNGGNSSLTAIPLNLGPGPFDYFWSPAVGLSNNSSSTVFLTDSIERTYTVVVTSQIDPSLTATGFVIANIPSLPLTFSAPDQLACKGEILQIGSSSDAGYSYFWTPGLGLDNRFVSNPTVVANTTMQYTVRITDLATDCVVERDMLLTVIDNRAEAGPDQVVCDFGTVTIGTPAVPNVEYSWTPAGNWQNGTDSTSAQPEVLVDINTMFTVTTTNLVYGCVRVDSVMVTTEPVVPPFALQNESYCPSDGPVTLGLGSPSGMPIYSWSPAALLVDPLVQFPQTIAPPPLVPTVFTLTIGNSPECQRIVTQSITPTISPPTVGGPMTLCLGETMAIGSLNNPTGANISYSWDPATDLDDPTSPTPNFTANTAGLFTYTLSKTEDGCTSFASVDVEVVDFELPPVASVTACENACLPIGVQAETGVSYYWSPTTGLNDPTSSNPIACVSENTIYELTAVGVNGCVDNASVPFFLNPTPAPTVTVPSVTACIGSAGNVFSPIVSPAGNYLFNWGPNNNTLLFPNSASPGIIVNTLGSSTYFVTVTNSLTGCSTVAEALLTVEACVVAVPLELLLFDGITADCEVELGWVTANEIGFSFFETQRSIDGSEYTTIGRVDAIGNNQAGSNRYSFTDSGLISGAYYQLKMVDFDGSFKFSEVIYLKSNCRELNGNLNIYPNPAYSELNVEIADDKEGDVQLFVVDLLGRVLLTKEIGLTEGRDIVTVDVSSLAAGAYFIRAEYEETFSITKKFTKMY